MNVLLVPKLSEFSRFEEWKDDSGHFEKSRSNVFSSVPQGSLATRTSYSSICTIFCTMIKHVKKHHCKSPRMCIALNICKFLWQDRVSKTNISGRKVLLHLNQQANSQTKTKQNNNNRVFKIFIPPFLLQKMRREWYISIFVSMIPVFPHTQLHRSLAKSSALSFIFRVLNVLSVGGSQIEIN